MGQHFIQVLKQCSSPSKYHPSVNNIGGKFGRGLLEYYPDGLDNLFQFIGKSTVYFIGPDGDSFRQTGNDVTAADLHGFVAGEHERRANGLFDMFGSAVADG